MPRRIYIQNQFSHAANEPNLQISLNFQFRQRKSDKANVKARKNEERKEGGRENTLCIEHGYIEY